jgi:apolipoprotein N-acyltransferase
MTQRPIDSGRPCSERWVTATFEETSMTTPSMRALLGFIAAAISVLTFHQAMWEALHVLALPGLTMPPPYPTRPVPPFGVPVIVSLCFWGGLYGAVFGLVLPRLTAPLWLCGLGLGVIAVLVGYFIVAPIKGTPVAGGWVAMNWVRSLLINGFWGIGVGVILPLFPVRSARLA